MTDKEKQEYIQKLRKELDERENKNNLAGSRKSKKSKKSQQERPIDYLEVEDARIHWRKAQESLKSAQILFENKCYNNCISRSYYAIFQTLATILKERNLFNTEDHSHMSLLYRFKNECVSSNYKNSFYHKVIQSLRTKRITSDYQNIMFSRISAEETLKKAEVFIGHYKENGFQVEYNFNNL